MGRWGTKPWEGDRAGEWFHSLMQKTRLTKYVEKTLNQPIDEDFPEMNDQIRAAATILVLLGVSEVWPLEDRERLLKLAISRLEELLAKGHAGGATKQIRAEIAVLKSRLNYKAKRHPERVKWWHFDEYA
jgi:hypothetical protein